MKIKMILAALLCSAAFASAQSLFTANLNGAQDGGGARTGSGIINATLNGTTFSFNGSFGGLSGTVLNGGFHIHGPAAPGQSTGVIYPLFPTMTLNADQKSGTMNGSITLATINPGSADPYTVSEQMTDLNNSLWYFNIHTTTFGGGEIRGQILPVPEPSTWALIGLGMLGALWSLRRKKA
jgi:CHRD domain-containing protein/PEP-CTERM motif-containing protein